MKCEICNKELLGLRCSNKYCNEVYIECPKCKSVIQECKAFEYRGALSCEDCFDEVSESREAERQSIISEEDNKTKALKGLDFGDNAIGKENKKLLKPQLEIASKESYKLRQYEGRQND